MIKIYCLRCKKYTGKNPKNSHTSNGRIIFLAHCAVYNCKKKKKKSHFLVIYYFNWFKYNDG